MKATKEYTLKSGKDAKYTCWGRRGCSHGMYNTNSWNYFVYGIKGFLSFEIMERW